MQKIAVILGTRPEAIKLIPVYLELLKSKVLSVELVSTGQHKEMLDQVFKLFKIIPDVSLNLMTVKQSLNSLSVKLINSLDNLFELKKYEGVIVQGDTTTAMISAMVAFNKGLNVFHVEAGLRSYDLQNPFPEEANRKVIGVYANLNFTPTKKASEALKNEKFDNNTIKEVGNTVIDSLLLIKDKIIKNKETYKNNFKNIISYQRDFVLVTAHRRESFGEDFEGICEAIVSLSVEHQNVDFVYPVHLNPNVRSVVYRLMDNIDNVKLIEPQSYDNLIYLMDSCKFIMTDSGGIQEEAPTLNKPVIVMRETTERMEGVENGCAMLVGIDKAKIIEAANQLFYNENLYNKMTRIKNPYGNGKASVMIVEALELFFNEN